MTDKPWSTRIPAAIAKGAKLLGADEYVLVPPHTGGNDTRLTVGITAGEVAMAKALWEPWQHYIESCGAEDLMKTWSYEEVQPALRDFTEKMEGLSHD